jgi:hypothetical protein
MNNMDWEKNKQMAITQMNDKRITNIRPTVCNISDAGVSPTQTSPPYSKLVLTAVKEHP